jgi:outer membrane protein
MRLRFSALLLAFFAVSTGSFAQEKISLEQVIGLALEKNYDVLIARNSKESVQTADNNAWAAFLPQINAQGSTTWNNNEQELRFQDASRNNSGKAESNNIAASVLLNWTLFDGTRMFATRERVDVLASQGELLVKNQMINTIAQTIINYYDIVRQKQQLKAIQEQMSVSEERVKLAERKLEVGTGIKPELLQAKVDFNAQRAQVIQQESAIATLKEQLNALVGMQLPSAYDVADTILLDLNIKPEELTPNIENTNYGLQAARENILISTLSLRENRANYLPAISFNAAYNYSKTDNIRLINPFSSVYSQSNGYNYGFTVTLPILNGFITRTSTQLAKINVNRQTLLYNQLKTSVNMDLKNAFVNYENAKRTLLVEEETILLAKENVFIALEGFKRGVTTFIELRTAQQSLADAYNRLISARYNTKVAETNLLSLSGALLK